ncbi:hypothetical protein DFH06DRAFT_1023771 [Mycena polygramma]|nr:hypothetical protein DFH06DRAFT_1023771 [Mycena polygramma]
MRVDDLWFPTDTIVIVAENKMFRGSGGILAARSTVFRDMIALPLPTGGNIEEKIDDCPVVRLHDAAEEVEVFLRAIYDSSYFMPAPAPIELSAVLGILRLSHKYDVQYLFRRALEHLATDGWYKEAYNQDAANHLINIARKSPLNALSIILAGIEIGAQWLLPYAYCCAATYSAEELLPFLDGKMGKHALKALAAHAHLVHGALAIQRFLITAIPCATTVACYLARESALSDLFDIVGDTWVNPFSRPTEFLDSLKAYGVCSSCLALANSQHQEACHQFWDDLPNIFGLPPWDELHAMERAAMAHDQDAS